MTHATANVVQQSFRGRDDDVGLNSSTFTHSLNTNWTQAVDTVFRVRFLIEETAGANASNYNYETEYNLNSGGWNTVTASSPVNIENSAQFTNNDTTTQVLGSGTFVTGYGKENNLSPSVTLNNEQTEMEYSLIIDSAQVNDGDTIQIRVTNAGTAIDSYANTPTITVSESVTSDVDLAAGSYTLAGQALDIDATFDIDLAAGSYTFTGQTLDVVPAKNADLAAGSYTLSGQSLDIVTTLNADLAAGSYTLTGQALDIDATVLVDLAAGSYTFTGQALDIAPGVGVDLATGSYTFSGLDLDIDATFGIDLAAGSYALSGQSLDIDATRPVDLAAGSYSFSGQALDIGAVWAIDLAAGTYTLAGQSLDVTVSADEQVDLAAGTYAFSGQSLDIDATYNLDLGAGSYTLTGQALDITVDAGAADNLSNAGGGKKDAWQIWGGLSDWKEALREAERKKRELEKEKEKQPAAIEAKPRKPGKKRRKAPVVTAYDRARMAEVESAIQRLNERIDVLNARIKDEDEAISILLLAA